MRHRAQKVCTKTSILGELAFGTDAGWRLWGQFPPQLSQEHLLIFLRLSVASKNQLPFVGGREMHIEHLDLGEFVQDTARG